MEPEVGAPAITISAGLTDELPDTGTRLPVGLQFQARPGVSAAHGLSLLLECQQQPALAVACIRERTFCGCHQVWLAVSAPGKEVSEHLPLLVLAAPDLWVSHQRETTVPSGAGKSRVLQLAMHAPV